MQRPEVERLIQVCVEAAAVVTPDDLPSLAHLHTAARAVREACERSKEAVGAAAPSLRVEELVEQLVLREAEDGQGVIREVAQLIETIRLTSGCVPPPAVSVASAADAAVVVMPSATAAVAEVAEGGEEVVRKAQADLVEVPITDEDAPMAVEFVGEATAHIEACEAALLKLEEEPAAADLLNTVFRGFHSIKGVSGFLNLKQVGRLAHAAETLLDLARKGRLELSGSRFERVLDALDLMRKLVASLPEAAAKRMAPPPMAGLAELVARLEAEAEGVSTAGTAQPDVAPQASGAELARAPSVAAAAETPRAEAQEATVKIATSRLDALIDAVGELVIAQSMVSQGMSRSVATADPTLARNLSQLSKITRGLQDLAMAMRMVPLHALFQKMSRLARDTARKAGRDVEFAQEGGETELDRNVVEAIGDPLVHMIRNAIDHGVEPAADRVAAGKPRAGRVTLRAFHQGGHVVIQISDDGRGLDRRRILERGIAAGAVRDGQELSNHDVLQLIFHPGLTTAERVTDISGRGVGMDVVKRNVEALRGRVEISSAPGAGSTFTIRLPLTLAVIDGLVVKVGAERYVLPINAVERSVRPVADELSTVQGRGELCMVRGGLLPILRLHSLFDVRPGTTDPTRAILVVARDAGRQCCLLVDELVGQQQVVIKSLGEGMGQVPGVSGCAILGDGGVSLILDVAGLVAASKA